MIFKQQQLSDVWSRGTPPLQSSLTRLPSCMTNATSLKKHVNDYSEMQLYLDFDPERHTSSALSKPQTSHLTKPLRLLRIKRPHQAKQTACAQSLTATQFRQQSKKLKGKGGGTRHKHKPQQGQQKGGSNQKHGQPKKKPCYNCGAEPSHPRSECTAKKCKCYKCSKEGQYICVCRSKGKNVKDPEEQAQPTAAQY